MTKSFTTTVKMPKSLSQKMLVRVIQDGYGMRGKSKWIIDAIKQFLLLPDYYELVDIADDLEAVDDIVSLRIPEDVMLKLEDKVIEIRKHYPNMEGVKSNIIRASILQRLIRG